MKYEHVGLMCLCSVNLQAQITESSRAFEKLAKK